MATLVDSFSSTWEQWYGGVTLPSYRYWVSSRTETVGVRSRTAAKTANYFTKVKTGQLLPLNALSYSSQNMSRHTGTFRYDTQSNKAIWIEPHWAGVDLINNTIPESDPEWIACKNRAIFDALGKARNEELMLPVTLLEAGKTATMVSSRVHQVMDSYRSLRRGDFPRFCSSLGFNPTRRRRDRFNREFGKHPKDTVTDAWLEYQYGWSPLLRDVRGAINLLGDTVDANSTNAPGVVRGQAKFNRLIITKLRNANIGCPYATINADWDVITSLRPSVRCLWRFRVKGSDLPVRLGLTNPAQVVWELVPFSFVADWFAPIGNYLGQFDIPYNFASVDWALGKRMSGNRSVNLIRMIDPNWKGVLSSGTNELCVVSRNIYTGYPSVSFNTMFQMANFRATINKAVSSIALLSQMFRGR